MRRCFRVTARTFLILMACSAAVCAQPSGRLHRVGFLWIGTPDGAPSPSLAPFLEGMRERGYVEGKNLVVEPYRRIVQSWRTTEFPPEADDSQLEVLLEPIGTGTRITLVHTAIPEGQAKGYEDGWEKFYFTPMKAYFF